MKKKKNKEKKKAGEKGFITDEEKEKEKFEKYLMNSKDLPEESSSNIFAWRRKLEKEKLELYKEKMNKSGVVIFGNQNGKKL